MLNLPTNAHDISSEEDLLSDVDEPPDLERTPRPSVLRLHDSFNKDSSKASFSKATLRCEQKASLLTTALHSTNNSPVEEYPPTRGMSCASTWSNNSMSTAELTSDGGFSSSTHTRTPSPPPPSSSFHSVAPVFKNTLAEPVSILHHDEEHISPCQTPQITPLARETSVEATLGRKRCITFACGPKAGAKSERKAEAEQPKPPPTEQATEPPKRACTIKFACPTKISTDVPSKDNKPRRAASPAPLPRRSRASKSPKAHRGSDSTVRNPSPIAVRKSSAIDRLRRLSGNSDLARCEAYRFHEFASSEEEIEEWTLESTCHRRPLTIKDTLSIENGLRQLGEEAEEEALDDEDDEDNADEVDEVELDEDEEDLDDDDSDVHEDISSDEGFQTDDEEGFAGSDDESDAGSDYNWWAPGQSTAATSIEHLDIIRPNSRRSISDSSIGSLESSRGHRYKPEKSIKRRKSRPVNIRIPSPELPDSTDFVCGTLDEDRPLEDAYMSCLERRRAAKHKMTPQDVDPTFPTSDPELTEEEDEDDGPDNIASESDQYPMVHGQMDNPNGELRGRRRNSVTKRSPAQSPRRLRSPPPPVKRIAHRSPPPRKLFGQSPKPVRSPPAPARLRSPPPTRRGSAHNVISPKRPGVSIRFAGLAERPAPTTSTSLPRTPVTAHPNTYFFDDEDGEETPNEFPVRPAIDIKVGLERKRQRRKEQLYKKKHTKNAKEKRPPPGKGCERMREVGLGLAAHKGKNVGLALNAAPTPDKNDMHVLSV
ncbi:hypothetical protein P280DRAFT_393749 [Massarina eburnea CBS 473.64]|uniref:Extensin domain-containing protein n=1 Tax=Massarina eburnea CBS 473.64 TaxID=1395130 RepID=A0A6A6S7G1_9PLEO|nr:hypothetical protein P280DRAFT_393749 [Massarina eburnea CBS 473.64]